MVNHLSIISFHTHTEQTLIWLLKIYPVGGRHFLLLDHDAIIHVIILVWFYQLSDPSHLLGHPNYMRMCDVLEILNGQLIERLRNHLKVLAEHVQGCEVSSCLAPRLHLTLKHENYFSFLLTPAYSRFPLSNWQSKR